MLHAAGAELTLAASRPAGWVDDDSLREFRALSMEDRLIQAFGVVDFAGKLLGRAKR